jgi:two-component system phosphate regulon sensor histidine kinase PhoR
VNNRYKSIGIASLVVLFLTQCYMTYHTYAWKEHDYYAVLRPIVGNAYLKELKGDLIYPGGDVVLTRFKEENMDTLTRLFRTDTTNFRQYARQVMDSLVVDLQRHSTLDTFMRRIIRENDLDTATVFRVGIRDLLVKIDAQDRVLFTGSREDSPLYFAGGAKVGGTLEDITEANRFTTILVDNIDRCQCSIRFSLWVDSPNRAKDILNDLLPILFLSLFCIALTVLLFLLTFRNWARQKKVADRKQDFVNSITHELNTPLTTIIVANRNLQDEQIHSRPDQVKMLSEIIGRNALWLKSLFTRVLQAEAITSSSLHLQPYVLHELLQRVVTDYELMMREGIQLKLSTFGEERVVLLDKFWFTSLIVNLIENGVKHNNSALIQLHLSVHYGQGTVLLKVKDNGVGVKPEDVERIFDKFYRNNFGKEGLGLGLYYVRQCVDAHGWKIQVYPNVDQGSTFAIEMPVHV